jgi:hypothetical protein
VGLPGADQGLVGHRLGGFAQGGAVHGDEARRDGLLRPGAAFKEAALDQNHIGAFAGHAILKLM